MQPVAVVIITWNSAHLIGRVLRSLEWQTTEPDRVLIIDNNSKDAEKLIASVKAHSKCELVLLQENVGFAAANNLAIDLCGDMEFIALLNPDAFPEPNWLATLLKEARLHPEAASFASRLLDASNPEIMDGAGDYLTVAGRPRRRGHGAKARHLFLKSEYIFGPCAAAALYRTEALRMVNGFDENFFCYIEDVDLAFRLLLAGYKSRYVADASVLHIGSASTGRRSEFSIYYGQRNLIFNYAKNFPPLLFWIFLIPHIFLNIAYFVGAVLVGQSNAAWRAKRDAVANFHQAWKQRRAIQSKRKATTITVLKVLKKSMW